MWGFPLYQAEKQGFDHMYISCLSSANIRKLFLSNQKKLLFLHEFAEYYCKKHKLLVFKFVSPKHINKRNDEKTRKIDLRKVIKQIW